MSENGFTVGSPTRIVVFAAVMSGPERLIDGAGCSVAADKASRLRAVVTWLDPLKTVPANEKSGAAVPIVERTAPSVTATAARFTSVAVSAASSEETREPSSARLAPTTLISAHPVPHV